MSESAKRLNILEAKGPGVNHACAGHIVPCPGDEFLVACEKTKTCSGGFTYITRLPIHRLGDFVSQDMIPVLLRNEPICPSIQFNHDLVRSPTYSYTVPSVRCELRPFPPLLV
jgi:hypothetical protein